MKVKAALDGNTFEAEDVASENLETLRTLFRSWLNAQGEGAVTIEELTEKLKASNDALQQAVEVNTPKE